MQIQNGYVYVIMQKNAREINPIDPNSSIRTMFFTAESAAYACSNNGNLLKFLIEKVKIGNRSGFHRKPCQQLYAQADLHGCTQGGG